MNTVHTVMSADELARHDYVSVARRTLIEHGIHPYDAEIFAEDLHRLRSRSCPVADAHEFFAGFTETLSDEQKVQP